MRSPALLIGAWVVIAGVQAHLFLRRLPTITAGRRAAELAEDAGAAARHRRERRRVALLVGLGIAGGTGTVLLAAWLLATR